MNLGQMMLVLGAIVLLGILILNANVTLLDTRDLQHTSEFGITAISLATSLLEEAGGKLFDNVVVDTTAPVVSNTSQLMRKIIRLPTPRPTTYWASSWSV